MADVEHSHWWYRSTRDLLREILDADTVRGGRFLDVGAGTGATGAWLAERGELVSSDFMPLALELNRERHEAAGFVAADVNRLPFVGGSFDVVLCVTVLCHQSIPDPQAAVAELASRSTGRRRVPVGAGRAEASPCPRSCHPFGSTILPQRPERSAEWGGTRDRAGVGCVFVPRAACGGEGSDGARSVDERSRSQRRWARRRAPAARASGTGVVAARGSARWSLGVRRRAIRQRSALRNSAVSSAMVAGTA